MQPLSFLLSQSCPPHHCINPSKAAAAAAVELGHLIFLWKKPVLSWQAPEQCHDVHQGDMDHKVMASRDCFQAMVEDNRTGHWLDSSDGQQHSEVLHFQVKIFSDVYFQLNLFLTIPLHRCQSSIVTFSSPGLLIMDLHCWFPLICGSQEIELSQL